MKTINSQDCSGGSKKDTKEDSDAVSSVLPDTLNTKGVTKDDS